jgi:FMN phosphatase YigB (HAD superfamily)
MGLQAITFDMWGTVLLGSDDYWQTLHAERFEAFSEVLDRNGSRTSLERIEAAYEAGTAISSAVRPDREPSGEERAVAIFRALGVEPTSEMVRDVLDRCVAATVQRPLDPAPGIHETLADLAPQLRLGVVSNTSGFSPGVAMREHLEQHGLLSFFEFLGFSDEMGVAKPRAEAFRTVLDELGVAAEAAAHVGDTPGDDIDGALAAGYRHAVLYGSPAETPARRRPTAVITDHRELPRALESAPCA